MKKAVIVKDYMHQDGQMEKFLFLKEYGYEVVILPFIEGCTEDRFMETFLKFETKGPDAVPSSQKLLEEVRDASLLITQLSPISTETLEAAENLEAVIILRSGVENVNLPYCTERGIKVMNVPGRLAVPVSEYTVGMIISETKNIARSHETIRRGGWSNKYPNQDWSFNLKNHNVGLVGYGNIGKRVARVMQSMEANVIVYEPYMKAEDIEAEGCRAVSLDELCQEADVISVHFRLTDETIGMIGPGQFALMKPGTFLVNTARAGLIDEQALIEALQNHKIAGAALDVFHEEPLPGDHPFMTMDNVTITAHIAGLSCDAFDIAYEIVSENIEHYLETNEWSGVVNQ
ncbi:2-hydroxyacid dehydrogenase [Faecalicatena orotica]|uniref:2-hydroxyacid dehydrogenase n=1 Tax=Faecalicatena orotica TaxID=1544 RepID=UPI003216C31F